MASHFAARLKEINPDPGGRRWLFVAYDQLSDEIGPLAREDPRELGIVLVENPAKAARRPYHRQKLAYVLANLRAYALEQAERGVAVRHVVGEGSYGDLLRPLAAELGPLRAMRAAEWELRQELQPLEREGGLEVIPHEGWLTSSEQFLSVRSSPPWRMDAFYRRVRQDSQILMERGKPLGGKYSYDAENRRPWKGQPPAPAFPRFEVDALKSEVGDLILKHYSEHPGRLDLETLPAHRSEAEQQWQWALSECLPHFGPFEDAMSLRFPSLFHSRISALLNLHRLLPRRLVKDVEARADLPLPCREGFIRQILGWREFVRHVHEQTEGFRDLPNRNVLNATEPLPPAYWGKPSGLACLDRVVADVWRDGYSHHITRLMVLSNLATLLGYSPQELSDWFWIAYVDAYDWVVEPNVLAMGTYSVGEVMTTKPYVSGSAYIDKMSDFCSDCAFNPKVNCPVTPLYWAFLERHRKILGDNPRMGIVVRACEKRDGAKKEIDARTRERLVEILGEGGRVTPEALDFKVDSLWG